MSGASTGLVLGSLFLSVTPAPCAEDWPIYRADRGLSGIAQTTLEESLELLWTVEAEGAITSSPVVWDGRVYFGSDDKFLYCVDTATGEVLWKGETEDMIEASPLVVDGAVYIGSSDFYFYAFDAVTGERRWRTETDDQILGSANYLRTEEGLRILVGSYDSRLYSFDATDGKVLWSYATENYINGTPAVEAGRVVLGGCDAKLHVVSAREGVPEKSIFLGPEAHIAGSIALVGGRAYFGHYGNEFVCVDLETSEVVWSYGGRHQPFFSSPAVTEERVVFGGRDKLLHCVRRSDGTALWTFPTRRKVDGSPVVAGDKVIFGSGDGRLYLLDLESGRELWRFDVGQAIISSPAVVDGRVYVGANDGRLYVFGPPQQPKTERDGGQE